MQMRFGFPIDYSGTQSRTIELAEGSGEDRLPINLLQPEPLAKYPTHRGVPPQRAEFARRGPRVADENRARPGPPRTGRRPWGGGEAESEGCGETTVEDDNEVWRDLRRDPEGWGQFPSFRRRSSLEDTPYSSLLTP